MHGLLLTTQRKSQLAIEYTYQLRSQSPATWAFWIHASNEARFEQSFRDVADQVKIPDRQHPRVNIFQLVENWLRNEKTGNWICVLDNVDNDQLLCSFPTAGNRDLVGGPKNASTKPLLEYIPRSRNGSIIITSRTREVALKMVHHNDLIEVKPMERSEALELLQRKIDQSGESQESQQLVDALEFIPLAIVQAASYIRSRAPRYSVSKYLSDFQGSDREATNLLKKEAGHLYRDWEAKNSILVTWQLSFDYIRQTKPSAAGLLSLMSLFDRQGIPENLIRHQPKDNYTSIPELLSDSSDEETSESDIGPDFEDDVTTLRDYSFISLSENGTFFTMHRLVQLTTRAWLKSHGQIDEWREKFIGHLYQEFPNSRYEIWEKCRPLFPHVRSAMSQRPKSHESLLKWATLLYRGARYGIQSGNIAEPREMASKSRNQRVKSLGIEDREALASTEILATAYLAEGQWEEAEKLCMQVIEILKTKYWEQHYLHPDMLTSMANLALIYQSQGRWEEAEKLFVQVIETIKTNLGGEHPSMLACMANLALTYMKQGQWNRAEGLFVQVIETSKTKFGGEHPNTLTSLGNLASTYISQGRLVEAQKLFVQIMNTHKTTLGEDHPNTLTSINNLASTYIGQGQWNEAEKLNMQVIKARKKKLSEDHPDSLASMNNLASTYMHQGQWEKAEKLHMQVAETRKKKLGENHPDTLSSMANLASTYTNRGRWEEAEKLNMQVMEARKTILGEDHPNTLTSVTNLASTYWSQGQWEEAKKLFVQVMETRKTKYGEDHPATLMSMTNVALTWKSLGQDEDALDLLRTCLVKQTQTLGPDHPHTFATSATLLEWATERLNAGA